MRLKLLSICAVLFLGLLPQTGTAQQSAKNCSGNVVISILGQYTCYSDLSTQDREKIEVLAKAVDALSRDKGFEAEVRQELARLKQVKQEPSVKDLDAYVLPLVQREIQKALSQHAASKAKSFPSPQVQPLESANTVDIARDGIPTVAAIVPTREAMTPEQAINGSACTNALKDIPKSTLANFPSLSKLIVLTESMDCSDKSYWFSILPAMTVPQVDRLTEILETERRKLDELDKKYTKEIGCLNNKHQLEWAQFQRNKASGDEQTVSADIEVARATLRIMGASGCDAILYNADDVEKLMRKADVIGETHAGARILAEIYSHPRYLDQAKADKWTEKAYDLNVDDWISMSKWVELNLRDEKYVEVFNVTRTAIAKKVMPELRGFSLKTAKKKIWTYKCYIVSASKQNITDGQMMRDVIVDGYNTAKSTLEKDLDEYSLSGVVFFAGKFRMLGKQQAMDGIAYLKSAFAIAEELRSKGRISDENLAEVATNVSWHLLLAGAPADAVVVAQRGVDVDAEHLTTYTNLAHGLLLTGKVEEAKKIYVGNMGKVVGTAKWETVINDDFRELIAAGIQSKEIPRVREWMLQR